MFRSNVQNQCSEPQCSRRRLLNRSRTFYVCRRAQSVPVVPPLDRDLETLQGERFENLNFVRSQSGPSGDLLVEGRNSIARSICLGQWSCCGLCVNTVDFKKFVWSSFSHQTFKNLNSQWALKVVQRGPAENFSLKRRCKTKKTHRQGTDLKESKSVERLIRVPLVAERLRTSRSRVLQSLSLQSASVCGPRRGSPCVLNALLNLKTRTGRGFHRSE